MKFKLPWRGDGIALLLSFSVVAIGLLPFVTAGFFGHDEGALAQPAMRILAGEVPHLHFAELYTGGLSYWLALVMGIFGESLQVLRWQLYGMVLLWVPLIYASARHFMAPGQAAITTMVAMAWGIPNHFGNHANWYHLTCVLLFVLCLLRFSYCGARCWLYLAGAVIGVSLVIKIVGIYLLAAGLLWLLIYDQMLSPKVEAPASGKLNWFQVLIYICALALLLMLLSLIAHSLSIRSIVFFVMPIAGILAVVLGFEWRDRGLTTSACRFARLLDLVLPLLVGALTFPVLFFLWMESQGAGSCFLEGVFVRPLIRFSEAEYGLPGLIPPACGYLIFFLVLRFVQAKIVVQYRHPIVCGVILSIALATVFNSIIRQLIFSMWFYLPVVVVLLAISVAIKGKTQLIGLSQLLLAVVVAFENLLLYPFAEPLYLFYLMPVVVLLLASIFSRSCSLQPRNASRLCVGAFVLILLCVVFLSNNYTLGFLNFSTLGLPRGSLRFAPKEVAVYERVIALIDEHSSKNSLLAAPDCPEIYFLSDRNNPTRSIYDFLDDTTTRDQRLKDLVMSGRISVVIINQRPAVSVGFGSALLKTIRRNLPQVEQVGGFEVRWKEVAINAR